MLTAVMDATSMRTMPLSAVTWMADLSPAASIALTDGGSATSRPDDVRTR
jgi:hypothetical protein